MESIDLGWLMRHPLPEPSASADKNDRGRVLVIGGAGFVPGAALLAGEAALRAGAGKLRIATTERTAVALGIAMPEAAIFGLPADDGGEISVEAADALAAASARVDALVLGPGMMDEDKSAALLSRMLDRPREALTLVLDAACIGIALKLRDVLRLHEDRVVITPHHGEMARLLGLAAAEVQDRAAELAAQLAEDANVTVVLKSDRTIIASAAGQCAYASACPGLATSGSGDVLAGIVGGLLARGAPPHLAASWGVWVHGEAGRALTERTGRAGFLARELLAEIPRLAHPPCPDPTAEEGALHNRSS
ncbi:MAG: NAD(P)H-hydrate dehydratase [Chakrabartia sp.]